MSTLVELELYNYKNEDGKMVAFDLEKVVNFHPDFDVSGEFTSVGLPDSYFEVDIEYEDFKQLMDEHIGVTEVKR